MRKIYLHIVLLLFVVSINAQENRVINGNFEDTIKCPKTLNSLIYSPPWYNSTIGSSVDLYNKCSNPSNPHSVSIPANFAGWQNPISKDGYIGFWIVFKYQGNREYATGRLRALLIKDSLYAISFFVSTADNSKHAIDRIGAYFSKDSIFQNNDDILPYSPQIESNSGHILDYRDTWHEIKGLYKAQGGEKYITLGCFRAWDSLTWKAYNPPVYIGEGAYYYIDSVTVMLYEKPDTVIPPKNPRFNLFPNPASDIVSISFEDIEPTEVVLELFDMLGKRVVKVYPQLIANRFEINIQFLASGVYAYRLNVDGKHFGDGKLIVVR